MYIIRQLVGSHFVNFLTIYITVYDIPTVFFYPFSLLEITPLEPITFTPFVDVFVDSFSSNPEVLPSNIYLNNTSGEITIGRIEDIKIIDITINATNVAGSIVVNLRIKGNDNIIVNGISFIYLEKEDFKCENNIPSESERVIQSIYRCNEFNGFNSSKQLSDIINIESQSAYGMNISWNTTFSIVGDYTFHLCVYDGGIMTIDNEIVIDLNKQCRNRIVCNESVVAIRMPGNYEINVFTYSSNNSTTPFINMFYNMPYSKENIPFTVKTYDNGFYPVLNLSTNKKEYKLLTDTEIVIPLIVQNGSNYECKSINHLPDGLSIANNRIIGIPKKVQDKAKYSLKCYNEYSETNIWDIVIEVTNILKLKSGFIAYYLKSDSFNNNNCETKLSPYMENVKTRIIRHEKDMNENRWINLNDEFNAEFGFYIEGYLYFNRSGYYSININHSDGIEANIGSNCSYENSVCSSNNNVIINCLFTEKTFYQFQLKYVNNYNIPFLNISFFIDNKFYPIHIFYKYDSFEYNASLIYYQFNKTIERNKPITLPSGKEKRFTINPKLPEGLLINETSGEIYGKPLVKEMSLKDYTVMCSVENDDGDPYIFQTKINIGITDYILPSRFLILNRITSELVDDDIIIFNYGERFDIEIVNKDEYIDHYEVFEELPNMIYYNTSNNSLRIYGIGNEYIHDVIVKYKAYGINTIIKKSLIISFMNNCRDFESNHYFRIVPSNLPIEGTITLVSVLSKSQKDLVFNSENLEMIICSIPQEYVISITATQSFTLYISVNGIDVLEKDIFISFKPFIFSFDTNPKVPYFEYNETIATVNEYTVIKPVILANNIKGFEIEDDLPKGMKFNNRNGYVFGIPIEIDVYYIHTRAFNLIGYSESIVLVLNVTENTKYMECKEDDNNIFFEFKFTLKDKEYQENMLLSLYSLEQRKEIYMYSSINTTIGIFGDEICISKSKYILRLIDTSPDNEGWRNNDVIISIDKEEIGSYTLLQSDYRKEILLDYLNNNNGDNNNNNNERKSNGYCQAVDDLPSIPQNETVTVKCMNNNTEGNITFLCSNDEIPRWIELSNYCYEDKPRILYQYSVVDIKLGFHYDDLIAVVFYGYDVKYTASNLPKGLSINVSNGSITGTSTYGQNKMIIIKGSNKNGEIEAEIMFRVIIPNFPVIEGYKRVVNLSCGYDYDNEVIMQVYGVNLRYSIYPSLNYKLSFSPTSGRLSGILFIPNTQKYYITIQNENGRIAFPITISCYLSPVPIILQRIHVATFYYQVEIVNYEMFKAIGIELHYSSLNELPEGIYINKTTGKLYGIPVYKDYIYTNTFTFRIESKNSYVDIPIDFTIMKSKYPSLVSSIKNVNLYFGRDIYIHHLFNISSSENYTVYLSKLPIGMRFHAINNSISGYASNQYESTHFSNILIHNYYGSLNFNIKFTLIKPSIPVLHIIKNNYIWHFYKNVEYIPTYIFESFGDITYYSITPELSEDFSFSNVTGLISGRANNTHGPIGYTIAATNDDNYTTFLSIVIEVITVYCEEEGEWEKTEIGCRAYSDCESAGFKYRDCMWVNNSAFWGDIVNRCHSKSIVSIIVGIICGCLFAIGMVVFLVLYKKKMIKCKKSEDIVLVPLITVQQEETI